MNGQRPIRPNYTNNIISYGPNIPINQTPYIFDNSFTNYEDNYTYEDEMNEFLNEQSNNDELRPIFVLRPNQQQVHQQQIPDVQEISKEEFYNQQIPDVQEISKEEFYNQQVPDVQEISKEEFERQGRYFDWLKAYKEYKQNMKEIERQVLYTPNGFTNPTPPPPSSPPPQFIQVPTINSTPSPVTRRGPVYITLTPQ